MGRKIVIIREMSAGNESVGEMWKETKIFDESDPLMDVIYWAFSSTGGPADLYTRRRNVIITIADEKDN